MNAADFVLAGEQQVTGWVWGGRGGETWSQKTRGADKRRPHLTAPIPFAGAARSGPRTGAAVCGDHSRRRDAAQGPECLRGCGEPPRSPPPSIVYERPPVCHPCRTLMMLRVGQVGKLSREPDLSMDQSAWWKQMKMLDPSLDLAALQVCLPLCMPPSADCFD